MAATFYSKLESRNREIRLMRLYPPQPNSTIKCELFVVSLLHKPSYEALSYVWGHSNSSSSIQLNGYTVSVTDNLYHALCRLQPLTGTRSLWVDQLCINLSDDDERGQQVEHMGRIYSGSSLAFLWLGEEACVDPVDVPSDQMRIPKTRPCTWNWIQEAHELNPGAGSYRPLILAEFDVQGQSEFMEDYIYLAFSLVSELATLKRFDEIRYIYSEKGTGRNVLRALWFIMHRPWWNRIWTLQECLLPPKALLMYGPVIAPFEMFLSAASLYTTQATSAGLEFSQRLPRANATTLRHFSQVLTDIDKYRRRALSGQKIDLVSTLRSFRIREATDDRDKVYGLLGLDIDWHGQEPLRPDYESNTPQVYQNTTYKLIRGSQSLDILINNLDRDRDSRKAINVESKSKTLALPSSASSELQALLQQIEGWKMELKNEPYFIDVEKIALQLPSWVPEWSSSTNFEVLSRYDQAELYCAARATRATATLVDESTLALKGLEVDVVRWSSQIMAHTGGEDRSSLFEDWAAFSADATAYSFIPVGTAGAPSNLSDLAPLGEAFWRTLCGDTVVVTSSGSPVATFHRATAQNYQDFLFWCTAHELGLLPTAVMLPDDTKPSSQGKTLIEDGVNDIHNIMEPSIRAATTMRRLFVTRKGFLGLGPPQTVGGEKVFILYGGKAPFLLRQRMDVMASDRGPYYELIGDCYVHGIMDGEAMSWDLPDSEVLII